MDIRDNAIERRVSAKSRSKFIEGRPCTKWAREPVPTSFGVADCPQTQPCETWQIATRLLVGLAAALVPTASPYHIGIGVKCKPRALGHRDPAALRADFRNRNAMVRANFGPMSYRIKHPTSAFKGGSIAFVGDLNRPIEEPNDEAAVLLAALLLGARLAMSQL